jgi:integrase
VRRTRYQFGTVERKKRKHGPDVWVLRYYMQNEEGSRSYASRTIGNLKEYPTETLARKAAEAIRMEANPEKATLGAVVDRYTRESVPARYSTRNSYLSRLRLHIKPKWGSCTLEELANATLKIARWLESLDMAPKSRGHLKALLHRLFECAMKWNLYPVGRNPMELVEVKNVIKRLKQPRVLSYVEFWTLLSFLCDPYRTMVLVAQCLGLRVSEVMALQWSDFDFPRLTVRVQRDIVHGRVDEVKTEYSNDDLPLDSDFAAVMLNWKARCPATPEGWVFPNLETSKPYWQDGVRKDHIQPAGLKAGLGRNIGWHTFRHTYRTWLDSTGAPVSMQRDLMRHASIQTTMNVYGRANMSEAKRQANSKVVRMALKSLMTLKSKGENEGFSA